MTGGWERLRSTTERRTTPSFIMFVGAFPHFQAWPNVARTLRGFLRGLNSGTGSPVLWARSRAALRSSCSCLTAGSVWGCALSPSATSACSVSRMSRRFSSLSGYFSLTSVSRPVAGLYLQGTSNNQQHTCLHCSDALLVDRRWEALQT